MKNKILSLLFFTHFGFITKAEKCEKKNSIDITNGLLLGDGSILQNGVTFPPKYVYKKTNTSSGEVKKFGCICELRNCLRKCCYLKSVALNGKCTYMPNEDLISQNGLALIGSGGRYPDLESTKTFRVSELPLVFGTPCGEVYLENKFFALREDGKLFIETPHNIQPWTLKTPDEYCVDTFILENEDGSNVTKLDALVCFSPEKEGSSYILSSTFMLISCVFIIATLAVYAWLPELRNLHGRVLMAYLFSLLVGFALLACMQIFLTVDNLRPKSCAVMTIFIYFALLSAFFWLNIMCFDIWWTFSGKRGMNLEKLSIRGRFYAYASYAYGIPLLLTVILAGLEFSDLPPMPFMPLLRQQGCFLYGNSKLLYLYGPILILCIANLIFFILTAIKIAKVSRQTSVLKSSDSQTHDPHRNDKQRLLLYMKLFSVMGVNWFLEVASAIYPDAEIFWKVTDAYNVLIGLIIFIIFVCKRKIFALIKKRIMKKIHNRDVTLRNLSQWNHKSKRSTDTRDSLDTVRTSLETITNTQINAKFKQRRGEPMSRTQTSSSRVSNRDDLQMDKVNGR